ncbi:glycosyltransferase [Chryseobacterium sp. ISL-6]|nr:glycosyltransferase [Chryseobacterium sp. ISL-6]
MPKISILIAQYNNGEFFKECYTSLRGQTYRNWEAIIVDDASTDNSLQIIRDAIKYDERFVLYENIKNEGCGFTKRKCVEYATGEILAFLDPDDTLYPTALEASFMEYVRNKDIVATYSKMMLCDEKLVEEEVFGPTKKIFNNKYFFNCPVQIAHFFTFKMDAYKKTSGINSALKSAVDQDLYLKILELGKVKFINAILYKYRRHSGGISQQSAKQNAKESFSMVIYEAMKRRGIKSINFKKVPDVYGKAEEINSLLNYQIGIFYRAKVKFKLLCIELKNIF